MKKPTDTSSSKTRLVHRDETGEPILRRRRMILTGLGATALGSLGVMSPLRAQSQPFYRDNTPIELIVPGGPGAGTDVVARLAATGIAQQLKNRVVVKNLPGAAGIIAAQAAARAKPNGYNLFFGITGTHTVNQFLYDDLPYDPQKDFEPISLVCKYNNVLVVRPDFEAQNFKDFIALVRANPGKYFYGITLTGSSSNLAMEFLKSEADLDLPGVPYGSGAAAVTDFLGGQYPILMDTVINQLPHIKAGRVIPLATTGSVRSHVLPDTPTISESGYPQVVSIGWGGIMAPAGTPPMAIDEISQALKSVLASPIFDNLKAAGLETEYTTPAQMAKFIADTAAQSARIVKAGNIKPAS
ncbi:Bug family tripartite tricarboxylate transporter substrate binding protein [Bordetella tumulicola]|uniref:Bug family tripartite tricarboxylate transporter substrate binding protein n=1 Tax=Bordetella tumulicola TaxID=1649133 RepID=UPI0039EE9424